MTHVIPCIYDADAGEKLGAWHCSVPDGCRARIETKDRFLRNRYKPRKSLMEDAKRKEIETRLRRLIEAAERDTKKDESNGPSLSKNIQVIRRRKGRPDLHIT